MKPIAEIFSQGEEVITGQTVDSNAAWLSQRLTEAGFSVKRHTAVGDQLKDLIELFSEIAGRADCCICTGGLGPTLDDLTAEAVARASGQPLVFDPQALTAIEQYYACRQRLMPEANRKQAYLPTEATRIDNPLGTAPGFALAFKRCWFVFLPGVPAEMQAMYLETVKAQLQQRFRLLPDCLVTLRSVGIGESAIQQALADLALPDSVTLGFRAAVNEVQTKLLFPADFCPVEKQQWARQVAGLIGDYVFAIDGLTEQQGDLLSVVDGYLQRSNLRLMVLETATQGLLAAQCLGYQWLQDAQIRLQIDAEPRQWLDRQLSQYRIDDAQTLILGQSYAGTREDYQDKNRAITVYNMLQTLDGEFRSETVIAGTPHTKQRQAAVMALDLLRRYLQTLCR